MDTFWTLVQIILGLEIIILAHIVGHFLAAKILRVQVEKFSLYQAADSGEGKQPSQ